MLIVTINDHDTDERVGVVLAEAKQFRTGSRGYHGQAKLVFDGKRYQVQVQLVEIGSKSIHEDGHA